MSIPRRAFQMQNRDLRALAVVIAIAGLLPTGRAVWAAPPAVGALTAAANAEANRHFDQGKAYYRARAYDLAIQEFLAGYEIDPRPGVLFNIGRAWEELGNRPKAIESLKQYVALSGTGAPAVAEARARVVALERQIREEEQHQQAEALARAESERAEREHEDRERAEREQAAAAAVSAAATSVTPDPLRAEATRRPPVRASGLKVGGLVAAGTGVALTGAAILLAIHGNQLNNEINAEIDRTQSWSAELGNKDADMRTANRWALYTAVAGGVTLAGGAVLYYLGWREARGITVTLAPVVAPPGFGARPGLLLASRF